MNLKTSRISFNILFFIIFCMLLPATQVNQPGGEHKKRTGISRAQLQQDFKIFRQALEEGHGGLYRYTDKADLDRLFTSTYNKINKTLTEMGFYKRLLPIIAAINDGHTSISPSTVTANHLRNKPILFPFNLRFINKKAYLFRNYSEKPDLPMGGELLSINKHPVSQILRNALPMIPSDAHIKTSKYRKLESTTYFGMLYQILYGESITFAIEYQSPDKDRVHTLKVQGLKEKDVTAVFNQRYPEENKEQPLLSLKYKQGVPILTIRTFGGGALQRAKILYPAFLLKTFKEITQKEAKNLIIDLRNNGGGSDLYGRLLVGYLLDKPFSYYSALETKNNRFDFFKYTNLPPKERTMPEERTKKNQRGWYDVLGHPNLGKHQPMNPHYRGNVYVLINGRSFSASGECTSIIHFHKRAKFVGEECGSGYYGNTSGFMPTLILPHSKLRVRIPLVRYTMAVSDYPSDRGIIPDYPFQPTINDLLLNKDTVLAHTLKIIKETEG